MVDAGADSLYVPDQICPIDLDVRVGSGIVNMYRSGVSRDALAMVCVNFDDAAAFCRSRGGRLPSIVEWELAAHGLEWRQFPWGNDRMTELAEPGLPKDEDMPVGSHKGDSTPEGILDLYGNVAEWASLGEIASLVDLRLRKVAVVTNVGGGNPPLFSVRNIDEGTGADAGPRESVFPSYDSLLKECGSCERSATQMAFVAGRVMHGPHNSNPPVSEDLLATWSCDLCELGLGWRGSRANNLGFRCVYDVRPGQ